ncbi:ABC transporter ATP-binding protein [Sedimentitalea sp. XS_ASV28]|uniref:ABC transporter ATP-binding protein n=1 Tax=Sedimentitalea sp. XS_ASV28 TaxID=3241296 RepID=UPI0035183926
MLTLENLSTADTKRPLAGLNARFEAGKIYTILGRTGAGKTELLRTLIGLDPIRSGAIRLDGADLLHRPVRARQMAMVYQQFINYPHLNALQNVTFPLRRQNVDKATAVARAREALALVGLSDFETRMPSELSGGQQQRVALARAVVKNARILLMDEPLANLDYKLREQLREEFPRLLHKNVDGVILYTTTEPGEAMQLGDELIVMHDGKIIAHGDPGDLFDNPPNVEVAQLISDPPISVCDGRILGGMACFADGSATGLAGGGLRDGTAVRIGIRPDALAIGGDIAARVTLAEFSGSDTILHLQLPFGQAAMLLDGIQEFQPGHSLDVALDARSLLLFSQEGANITGRIG